MTKVSVIVPIYNVEEYLEECLDSLVAQTIDSLEIILVDDGSLDDSGKIAQRYADSHDNVFCHHIPNGGLGHARNYGVQFARGKYVCFADSDDVIPEYAYQEMYELGEKNHSDMVIGDVKRFNSRRQYSSGLHRRAFRHAKEIMHITDNPDLLYDTTSWNKLYNSDFYKREHLFWAEGIMYEDIPVTIPAHYKANHVSYLPKTVYLWRARDGVSASITQRREELSNFMDRLTVMKMVDEFFDKNIADRNQHLKKDEKWLSLDFKMYINKLDKADNDYRSALVDSLADYLKRVDPRAYENIKAIDRLKYYCIARRDIPALLDVLSYEKKGMKSLKVREKNGRFYGEFPFPNIPYEQFDMTGELRQSGVKQKARVVKLGDEGISISGRMEIPLINTKRPSDVRFEADLVDSADSPVVKLRSEVAPSKKRYSYHINRSYKKITRRTHGAPLYSVSCDKSALTSLPDGVYKVQARYSARGLRAEPFYLGKPRKGGAPRPYASCLGDRRIWIDYDLNYDMCLHVERCERSLDDLAVNQDGSLKATLTDGSHTEITVGDLTRWTQLDIPFFSTTPTFKSLNSSLLYYVANKEGMAGVQKLQPGGVVTDCCVTDRTIDLTVDLNRLGDIRVSEVFFKGNRYAAIIPVLQFDVNSSADTMHIVMDCSDDKQVSAMRADSYELFVAYSRGVDSELEVAPVYGGMDKSKSYGSVSCDHYRYTVSLLRTHMHLYVKHIAGALDKSKRRKRLVRKYLYPIMRKLPIKNNMIVFESSWGAKTDCNPGAFYEYIRLNHPEYECVWSLNDPRIPLSGDAKRVVKGSAAYFYAMARTKYLINNVNFIDAYEKRKGQIEIQTMHGTPLKTLGLDVPGELPTQEAVDVFLRRCNRWDYLVVQSERAETITKSCYAYKKAYLETGYPRNDVLFRKNNPHDISELKKSLGVDPNKKLILYAPTWRKRGRFDLELDLAKMCDMLGDQYQVGLRVHQFAMGGFSEEDIDPRVLNLSFVKSMEELFLVSDVVITDYSSLMFDYAVLHRPLLFYVYDLEEYRDKLRGFNIDLEAEAPGPLLFTTDEVISAIDSMNETVEQYGAAYERFREQFCSFENGHACEEIYRQVFESPE